LSEIITLVGGEGQEGILRKRSCQYYYKGRSHIWNEVFTVECKSGAVKRLSTKELYGLIVLTSTPEYIPQRMKVGKSICRLNIGICCPTQKNRWSNWHRPMGRTYACLH